MKTRELLILPLILLLSVEVVRADSATWNLNPDSGDWNTAANWTPATVPNGPGDTAFFGLSNATSVAYSGPTQLDGILFNPGASAFTITCASQELTISGLGITNNSGIGQNFVVFNTTGTIKFIGGAKAGSQTVFTNNYGATQFFYYSTADSGTFVNYGSFAGGGTGFFDHSTASNGTFFNNGGALSGKIPGGVTYFRDNASAGNGAFTNQAGSNMFFHGANLPGRTLFLDNSTAASGTFTNNGGAGNVGGGWNIGGGGGTYFDGTSTAGNGTFTNNGGTGTANSGGHTYFDGTSTAGNGIFTNNGGVNGADGGGTVFTGDSSGGTGRIILLGNGELDISGHNAPGMKIGSIEGDGNVFLGANRLGIGSNNLSTTFFGSIKTGRNNERGGSFEKIGSGTLTLSGTNTYDRGTLISAGTLEITQDGGLGTGDVIVTASGATLRLQTGAANNYIADTAVFSIVGGSTVDLNFDGAPDTVQALVLDGVVQPAGLYGSAASGAPHQLPEFTGSGKILAATATTPTPTPTPTPRAHATNLSTRLLVGTGNDVGIGGFIVTGNGPRHLLLRGIGPSLSGIIGNALPDPLLQLRGPTGFKTLTNDNWRDTQEAEIIATGRAPGNDLESAIVADLAPGAYTAILPGNGGTTGAGLFEIYDLSANQDSRLANISTRASVGTGDDIMIAGVILGGASGEGAIIVRAIGPSLAGFPPGTVLPDPRLELRDRNGQLIIENDNWMDDANQAAIVQAAGLAPSNNFESAIAATLLPGEYTALLSGVNNGTGVGLVGSVRSGSTRALEAWVANNL